MTANLSTRASAYPRRSKALGLALVSILAVVVLVGSGGLHVSASASNNFDNVQVFIQTSQNLPYSYTLAAYNTSGIQVAYYQSDFAAAAFELPNGTYLFTVQASYNPAYYPCIGCVSGPMIPANSTTATNSTVLTAMPAMLPFNESGPMIPANSTSVTNSTAVTNSTGVTVLPIFMTNSTSVTNSTVGTVIPIFSLAPSSNEYGYAIEQVTGPSSITINTQNATVFPTTQVTVHVAYVNGTAAQGAWVYASVVDNYYYYYGPNVVSEAQTGTDGTAVLTMPQAPLLITSYLSVPITLPQSQSNVTVTIGGQKVNVTLYWQPNSITLEGQTLILPPQTSGNITLQYQPQQYYYPIPLEAKSTPGTSGTTTTQTVTASTTTAGQNTVQGRIPPFNLANVPVATHVGPSTVTTTTVAAKGTGGESWLLVDGAAVTVVALAALTLLLVTVRGKRKPNIVSA